MWNRIAMMIAPAVAKNRHGNPRADCSQRGTNLDQPVLEEQGAQP